MTPPPQRRRASTLPAGDLDELLPHLGLWRFAWLWLTRGDRPIEAEEAPKEAPPSEIAPPRKRRITKREPPAPDRAAFRKRAWSWLGRSTPVVVESKRRRVVKAPPEALGLRARSRAWLARSIPAPAAEPKRRRIAKAPSEALGLRLRAWAWLTRKRVIEARGAPSIAPEPKRRRIPIAVLRAYRKRAWSWLLRPREIAPEPEILAPAAPVIEPPSAGTGTGTGKRKRGPKAPPPPPPPPPDPVWIFRRRAYAWFEEGGATTPLTGVQHPGGDVARAHLRGVLEALVFASEHPLPAKELARLAKAELRLVKALLAELVLDYHGRGFRLEEVAGGYIFRTSPAFAPFVREQVAKKPIRMSRAQIETLAIVAYRQPITRPEVDDVRGVDSGAVLKSLLERDFVRMLGKKDEPGRPILYGTTGDFLEFFGLKTLGDLPTLREFTELTDESKRTFEREMGEEPPEEGAFEGGLMGGEGDLHKGEAPAPEPPRPVSDYEDADESVAQIDESVAQVDESVAQVDESEEDDDDDDEDEDEDEE